MTRITNRGRRHYKLEQAQKLQNGAKGLQIGAGITKRGKKITNWGRDYKSVQNKRGRITSTAGENANNGS